MPVFEDDHGTYIFNSKDLCTIEFIDKILDIGVDSLKIEGRMKGIYYVANCVKVYRDAIDSAMSVSAWRVIPRTGGRRRSCCSKLIRPCTR